MNLFMNLHITGNNFNELPKVEAFGIMGPIVLQPEIFRPVTHLERLWAYVSVKQLLDARETTPNKTRLEKEALDLALKYSFVTPLTSLVVVKPNDTNRAFNAVPADQQPQEDHPRSLHSPLLLSSK